MNRVSNPRTIAGEGETMTPIDLTHAQEQQAREADEMITDTPAPWPNLFSDTRAARMDRVYEVLSGFWLGMGPGWAKYRVDLVLRRLEDDLDCGRAAVREGGGDRV